MLQFYDVDLKYIAYLKSYDKQIPNINYKVNNKFLCGVVLDMNGIQYYAPISSNTTIQRTNTPIYDNKGNILSTIKLCFMFPALNKVINLKDFAIIRLTDNKYADLLEKEYEYCKANENIILDKAKKIYKVGCNKEHFLNYTCCDFKLLESIYDKYID